MLHLVLDCADPEALAPFWATALGYEILWTFDPYVGIGRADAPILLLLQKVPEPKAGKNRMHIDIPAPDLEAKTAELVAAGAKRLDDGVSEQGPARWIRMADPEGNEFCITAG